MNWIYETREIDGKMRTRRYLAPATPEPEPEPEQDLSDMTKAELISLAEERGVELKPRMTKAKIIAALEGNEE